MATQGMKRHVLTVAVDNPYYSADHPENQTNPRIVDAVVSLRQNSIISLAERKLIDADQVAAAWRFRKAWETVQSATDHSAGFGEWVDRTCRPSDVAEKRLAAAADLRVARRLLGAHGYDLVSRICGDGFHIRDIHQSRRARDTATDMLRIYLTSLARLWH